jgi:hypothetical protein
LTIYFSSPRYPDDVFDRLWVPRSDGFISKLVSIDTYSDIDTNDSTNIYKLPAQVLSTAIKPASGYTLRYDLGNYDQDSSYEYYVCFHFAEIEELKEGEIREFFIDVNEGNYISENITLEYLKPFSRCPNQTFEGHFSFTINATAKSNLPPLLNALEIYHVFSLPDLPTDPGDGAFFSLFNHCFKSFIILYVYIGLIAIIFYIAFYDVIPHI